MAINFNLLAPQPGIAESFFSGQQAAQNEQNQNLLRQAQLQQMQAQREDILAQQQQRLAIAEERRSKVADAARREKFLTDLSTKMAEGGHRLDRPTLTSMLQFGMLNKEDALVKLAGEGLRALDEQEQYEREAPKYGLPGRPAAAGGAPATPSIMARPAPGPTAAFAAPAAQPELLAGTPFAIGAAPAAAPVAAAAPANALAAPEGFTREQVQNMLVSPVASIRARGEALSKTLLKEPKEATDIEVMRSLGFPLTQAGFAAYQASKKPPAPVTNVSVTSPTGKSLSAPVGQRAEASLVKAEGAAGIMESANSVREALNSGNVIAGPLANVRMKFAQVLELAGAGDKQKLINSRTAIQGLATLTLESRAELKGQGQVTENEQKLLERARSGNIEDMTIAELQQVVNVSQRLANRLWSSHQTLLKTMEADPAAADALRYYRPTVTLPSAVGEGKPQGEAEKRAKGLSDIFGGKK